MNRGKKRSVYAVCIILALLFVALAFYLLNYFTPLFADDYSYSYSFAEPDTRIGSFSDILQSQINHYYTMNGRAITHTFAQLFLWWGKDVYNILNVFLFLLLLLLMYYHARGTFKNFSVFKLLLIAFLLFMLTPAFGQSFLWLTSASNYLISPLIVLAYLIPFRMRSISIPWAKKAKVISIILSVIYGVCGIIAGWTNENNSVALISMIIAYLIYYRIRGIKICSWHITALFGSICGASIMLLAPGTNTRLESFGGFGSLGAFYTRGLKYTTMIFEYYYPLILFFFVLLVFYAVKKTKQWANYTVDNKCKNLLSEVGEVGVQLIGFLASVYSMIIPPFFPTRTWSGPTIYLIVFVMCFFEKIDWHSYSSKMIYFSKRVATIVLVIVFAINYVNAIACVKYYYMQSQERVSIIQNAIENGEDYAMIPALVSDSRYTCFDNQGDVNEDSSVWPNTAYAQYFGIKEIRLLDNG